MFYFQKKLDQVVRFSALLSGGLLLGAALLVTLDICLRIYGKSVAGAYDLVKISGFLAASFAFPYATASRSHIAVRFLIHNLKEPHRKTLDFIIAVIMTLLLLGLSVLAVKYGYEKYVSGETTNTLCIPVFSFIWIFAFQVFMAAIIKVFHAYHLLTLKVR